MSKGLKKTTKRTILITGATSGIGLATAKRFAKNGYNLILTGRRKKRLDELKATFKSKYGVEVKTLNYDIRKFEECEKAINSLPKEWKQIDILFNNAGLASGYDPIQEGKIEDWETMIDTNVKGLLYMTRLIAPLMIKNKKGHIINTCSTAGHDVYPNGNVYCASKHAVEALSRAMRIDLHKTGIRVSQVSPGHVEETEFAKVRFHGDEKRAEIYNDFNPLKSKDVGKVVYFLATQPKHVNIQEIVMMGTQQANSNFIDRSGRKYD
jgi:NADP-dependent 3-hydroxy acid dehydrogenase YdfG